MRRSWPLLLLLVAAGCAPPTAMTLEFTTNLPCPQDRTARYLGVAIGGSQDAVEQLFTEVFDASGCADGGVLGTWTVRPPAGDKQQTVNVRAALAPGGDVERTCSPGEAAADPSRCIVARRRVRFTPGAVLRVPLTFYDSCLGRTCSPEETCVTGGLCVSREAAVTCAAGACEAELPGCVVDGVRYAPGATSRFDPCLRCLPTASSTALTPTACPDDGNPCTTDACGGSGECLHPELPDGSRCGSGRFCRSGVCVQGCVIGEEYQDGALRPGNPCQRCAGALDSTGWSPVDDGAACADDQEACTTDACRAGACAHEPVPDGVGCDGGGTCQAGACALGCTVGGDFFPDGAANPGDACEVCDAARSTQAFSARASGTACPDDGNPCTSDLCQAGACAHEVKPDGTGCGSGLVCAGGSCGAKCVIAGASYAAGVANPANACQSCQPGSSTTAWSPRPDDTACATDNNPCTRDVCTAGVCSHPPTAMGSACTGTAFCSGTTRRFGFACNGSGACVAASSQACPTAGPCQTGGGCAAGACVAVASRADGTACSGVANGMCCSGGCVNSGANPNCGVCGLNCGTLACGNSVDVNQVPRSPPRFVCVGVSSNLQCQANYGAAATAYNNQCNCQCSGGATTCAPGGKCPVCWDVPGTNYCTY